MKLSLKLGQGSNICSLWVFTVVKINYISIQQHPKTNMLPKWLSKTNMKNNVQTINFNHLNKRHMNCKIWNFNSRMFYIPNTCVSIQLLGPHLSYHSKLSRRQNFTKVEGTKTNTLPNTNIYKRLPIANILRPWTVLGGVGVSGHTEWWF